MTKSTAGIPSIIRFCPSCRTRRRFTAFTPLHPEVSSWRCGICTTPLADTPNIMKVNTRKTEATCLRCGCTDSQACPGGCHWITIDRQTQTGLCSKCHTLNTSDLNKRTGKNFMITPQATAFLKTKGLKFPTDPGGHEHDHPGNSSTV